MTLAVLKPGPFQNIVKVRYSPKVGYGTFQFGTARDSREFYPQNAGVNLNIDVFCFVFSKPTFPEKWTHAVNNYYTLSYKDDNGFTVFLPRERFSKLWFATYGIMNNVVVGGRALPPGPFLDANALSTGAEYGYDLDYGLINYGFNFQDPMFNNPPNYYIRYRMDPYPLLGRQIKITAG